MIYLFVALIIIGALLVLPPAVHLVLRKSSSLLGDAAKMIPLSVYIVWMAFAICAIVIGTIGLLVG